MNSWFTRLFCARAVVSETLTAPPKIHEFCIPETIARARLIRERAERDLFDDAFLPRAESRLDKNRRLT